MQKMKVKRARFSPLKSGRFQNIFLVLLFVGLVVGVGGVLTFNNLRLYQKTHELEQRAEELREEKEGLEQLKEQLEREIADSQTPEYQEKILRGKGLYQKPGERVITVVPQEEGGEAPAQKRRIWWDPRTWVEW